MRLGLKIAILASIELQPLPKSFFSRFFKLNKVTYSKKTFLSKELTEVSTVVREK